MSKAIEWCEARPDQTQAAVDNAIAINPANAPVGAPGVRRNDDGTVTVGQPLTGIAEKFWRNGSVLQVSFTNGSEEQQTRVMRIASRWSDHANIQFERIADRNDPAPDIRVTFDGSGNWSKIGTDSRLSTHARASSMNFSNFVPNEDTVLHEFGHALGLKHEHQNPKAGIKWNKEAVYKDFSGGSDPWDKEKVDRNVFNVLTENSLLYSRFDPQSVMGYTIWASWTTDGFSLTRGTTLSAFDISGIGDWYPFGGAQRPSYKPGSDDMRVLTRGISGRMFERRWDGTRWATGSEWALALTGEITGHPGTPNWNPGTRMAVVARATSGEPVAAEFSGGRWGSWTGLGGGLTGSPMVLATGDWEWCFVRGESGRPFFKRRALHGAWDTSGGGWSELGGAMTGGFSGDTYRSRMAIAVRGSSGQAAIKWWDGRTWQPGATSWVGLGAQITAQPAIVWTDDALHVVARFPDGTPHHLIYDTATGRTTRPWTPITGGILGSPTLVREGSNVIHLLVRGISRRTFRRVWRDGAWSPGWEDLAGQALDSPTGIHIAGIGSRPGQLNVFVTGVTRRGFRKVAEGARWTPVGTDWESLGGILDWGV